MSSPDAVGRLRKENEELRKMLEAMKDREKGVLGGNEKKWSMGSIALSFIAGGIFVVADGMWPTNQFLAGVLYAVGSMMLLSAVPALHATGTVKYVGYHYFQPFSGGIRFVVLQALSWAFYSLAVIILLFAVWYGDSSVGLLSSSGVLGILSQVLMASSLQTFVTPGGSKPLSKKCSVSQLHDVLNEGLDETPLERLSSEILEPDDGCQETEKPMDSFAELLTMNTLLILIMIVLSCVSEYLGQALPAALSLLITCVVVLLTHGLGGKVLRLKGWTFFQPFAGGTQFVILQGVTWMLFTISLLCQMAFLYAVAHLGIKLTMGLMHVGGIAALTSEILCVVSFRYFKGQKRLKKDLSLRKVDRELTKMPYAGVVTTLTMVLIWNVQFLPFVVHLLVMLLPCALPIETVEYLHEASYGIIYKDLSPHDVIRASVIPMASIAVYMMNFSVMQTLGVPRVIGLVMSPPWVAFVAMWIVRDCGCFKLQSCVMALWFAYCTTYIGDPDKGIRKRYDAKWTNSTSLWERMREYFGGRVLVSAKLQKMLDEGKGPCGKKAPQHMVGYHPHGIIPSGMVWGMRCKEWQEKLPGFELTGLTASIMHYVPLMRDILHWCGIREVSRKTLYRTIDEGLNPCVVVGGQAEMFMSRSRDTDIKVVRFHTGFFKIAAEKHLPCIPIFAFGETKIYDNIELPTMQKWFKARVGFPIPFIPIGRWGLPVPRRRKVILAVGAPVQPCARKTSKDIEEFKNRYFVALQELFDEFKDAAGYEDHRIVFVDDR
eukprot:TRINITY_DN8817_c0_g1_i1.p1 TRINITY_DN8817_c0_g1~~TRINITY_DN8817_c0_g1_i1.p1  ORF type:complete len:808 (+),score=119.34 TRINITY_DN8817_c0_g1_i1:111-2426(+)